MLRFGENMFKNKRSQTSLMISLSLVLASFVVLGAPSASAHTCAEADRDSCDPGGCTEGEAHDHTHYRWPAADEYCQSEAEEEEEEEEEDDDVCRVADKEFPDWVCDDPLFLCNVDHANMAIQVTTCVL